VRATSASAQTCANRSVSLAHTTLVNNIYYWLSERNHNNFRVDGSCRTFFAGPGAWGQLLGQHPKPNQVKCFTCQLVSRRRRIRLSSQPLSSMPLKRHRRQRFVLLARLPAPTPHFPTALTRHGRERLTLLAKLLLPPSHGKIAEYFPRPEPI